MVTEALRVSAPVKPLPFIPLRCGGTTRLGQPCLAPASKIGYCYGHRGQRPNAYPDVKPVLVEQTTVTHMPVYIAPPGPSNTTAPIDLASPTRYRTA